MKVSMISLTAIIVIIIKSKAIPVTGCGGLYDCEMLRLAHFQDSRLRDGGEVSLTRQTRSTSQKHYFCASDTHFC
jgi:hypothetical protein